MAALIYFAPSYLTPMVAFALVLAALASFAVAAPTVASAESFGFRIGGGPDCYYRDRDYRGPRVEFYGHDRGWHRGWYRDGDYDGDRVIIRRNHYCND